ncbi:unnamed protein product [Heligmosomoides polygyrus]|uniref:HTH_48 domain-containing protein n=1 Tax=Heligmosomoides polygyrus TaxID=6339 RepID=A0A183G059_HELPZ|nr:unnamed protein product [Heligmosomoides polygyrus]
MRQTGCRAPLREIVVNVLYEWKSGHKAATPARNINAALEDFAKERTIRHWFEKFRSADENLEVEDRGGPPSLLNDDQLKAMVEADPCPTVVELAKHFGVDGSTISRHSDAMGKVKKLDEWIPHELTTAGQILKRHHTVLR